MLLKIKSYRITKKGNYAFQTGHGEIYLNLHSAKCRKNFIKYFPHSKDRIRDIIERGFDPDKIIGKCCFAYPILHPIEDPKKLKYELEQALELQKIN